MKEGGISRLPLRWTRAVFVRPAVRPRTRGGSFSGEPTMSSTKLSDRNLMRRAIRLAARGVGRTHPNPPVGALVVRGGEVVGEGWHRGAGHPHAEVEALARAGRRARGATLVVTLEPCAHQGRTPPCTEAVTAAGVRRCVVAVR